MRLRSEDVSWTEVDGQVVVLDLRAGQYLEINASGAFLFGLLTTGADEDAMARALQARYDIDPVMAQQDVSGFVAVMRQHQLLDERDGQAVPGSTP